MTGSLIGPPTLGDRTIADDRTRHHAPRARMDGWWTAAARTAPSQAYLQKRGAQLKTALTTPPFSWINYLIRSLDERRWDRQAQGPPLTSQTSVCSVWAERGSASAA